MPRRLRGCIWCGYRLPDGQLECAPLGRSSDFRGSVFCRDHRGRFTAEYERRQAPVAERKPRHLGARMREVGAVVATLRARGMPLAKVAEELNRTGIRRPRSESPWDAAAVGLLSFLCGITKKHAKREPT